MRTLLLIIVFLSAKTLLDGVEDYEMTLADTPINITLQSNGMWRASTSSETQLGLYNVNGNELHIITETETNTVDMSQCLVIPQGIDWDTVQEIDMAKIEFGSPIVINRSTGYLGFYQTNG